MFFTGQLCYLRQLILCSGFFFFTGQLCYLQQPSFVLSAIGLEMFFLCFALNWISISSKLLSNQMQRWYSWRIRSIPTASAVRYYTVTLSLLWLLCFPLSCQATWCCSCWVCAMGDQSQNRYSTLTALVIYLWSLRSVNLLIERPALIVFGSSVEQFGCSLIRSVVWSSGAIDHRLQYFGCTNFVSTSSYYQLWAFCVNSIGLINIMLVVTSNSESYIN